MQRETTAKLGHEPARRDASKTARNSQSAYKSKSKSKLKLKSARKPLREVVNGVKIKPSATKIQPSAIKNTNNNNNNVNKNSCLLKEEECGGDESLDRLLLIHSDLSSLLHQIDDLVGKAIRLKATSKNDRKEIESFALVLSEMQNSLKPWVPRFQQSISSSSLESNNQLEKSLTSKTVDFAEDDDNSDVVGSPAQSNWDLLVSPSPLVSWRAGCTNEAGRQLFLLTPLPKGAISKFRGPSKPATENSRINTNAIVGQAPAPSHFVISEDMKNDLVEDVAAKSTPYEAPDCSVICTETTMKGKFKSPEKHSKVGCSMVAMTPCREVSPPKSCKLLEPLSALTHKKVRGVRASTPFPTGLPKFSESDDDPDYSSGKAPGHLISKYPELVGIKLAHQFGNGRKVVEASPVWCMSPPKTCIVLEPPEDKMLHTTTSLQFPTAYSPCGKTKKEPEYQGLNDGLAATEDTPLWKEPRSIIRTGKHPGENTLKKELWTRFEAATIGGHRFGEPVCQDASNKGFLDLLEEVSYDEETDAAAKLDR